MIEKVRFVPSKRRFWLGFVACSVLVGLGCLKVQNGDWFCWFFIIFFGLGVFTHGLLLRPGASWLELDEDGFTLCHSFKQERYLWIHVTQMAVWQGVVSFRLLADHPGNKRGQSWARAMSGYDGSIPNMFSLAPQSLLELMLQFQRNKQLQQTTI